MASHPIPLPISLPVLVADLATTRQRHACVMAAAPLSDRQHGEIDALDARGNALEKRIAETVYALTGVPLEMLARVVTL